MMALAIQQTMTRVAIIVAAAILAAFAASFAYACSLVRLRLSLVFTKGC